MEGIAASSLSKLSDQSRARAIERFRTIRPFLEDGVSLAAIARERGIDLSTARRWVKRYRQNGLAGLARKERDDKHRRKLSPDLRRVVASVMREDVHLVDHGHVHRVLQLTIYQQHRIAARRSEPDAYAQWRLSWLSKQMPWHTGRGTLTTDATEPATRHVTYDPVGFEPAR